jgi:carbon-monoxide dehydrogenase medium subunit
MRAVQLERYEAPRTVADAVAILARERDSRVLAGGTDLLVQMRTGRTKPRVLVDVKRIPDLRVVTLDANGLRIGAGVSCAEIREVPGLAAAYPGLHEAVALIGSEQIQGRATVAGNLCNASPAADTVPALIALGARAVIAGPKGTRELPVEQMVTAPGRNALAPGELLVELRVAPPAPRAADAYLRLIPRSEMDIAVVGAGVWLALDARGAVADARVALGAVAPTAILVPDAARALIGAPVNEASLTAVATAASAAARPIDDQRGTVAYRRRVAGVLARRAAAIAAERAAARS